MHIQCRNQQLNRRHIKLTYLLMAPELARGLWLWTLTYDLWNWPRLDQDEPTRQISMSSHLKVIVHTHKHIRPSALPGPLKWSVTMPLIRHAIYLHQKLVIRV